jgi:hypothetical protein
LEDKLFAVIEASGLHGEMVSRWRGGTNAWMILDELQTKERYFTPTLDFIAMLESGEQYRTVCADYTLDKY